MSKEKPLLSDFLEELKVYKEGAFLDKTVSIFYNDWSLNPDYEDDYSERVFINMAKLKNLNPKEYKSYRVAWWDQNTYVPNFVDICVQENKIMKGTKSKQKVFEDNASVPQYYFEGGAIKAPTSNKIVGEGWNG